MGVLIYRICNGCKKKERISSTRLIDEHMFIDSGESLAYKRKTFVQPGAAEIGIETEWYCEDCKINPYEKEECIEENIGRVV